MHRIWTIAGEAYAADDAIDRASLANSMLTELLTGESVIKTGPKLQHAHATDCRSLFDAVISSNPNTEEKRVLLTVRAIQEAIDTRLMRWVPATMMVADVLTKDAEALRWAFLPWLREPVCQLRETWQQWPQPKTVGVWVLHFHACTVVYSLCPAMLSAHCWIVGPLSTGCSQRRKKWPVARHFDNY